MTNFGLKIVVWGQTRNISWLPEDGNIRSTVKAIVQIF